MFMKTVNIIRKAGILLAATCLLLSACDKSSDEIRGNHLSMSVPNEVILREANEADIAVTFYWNKGIERNPTDTVTYIFRMDIANNNFETATSRDTVTNFTKSFTVGELNELIATQWKVLPGRTVELEARVVANVRGEKFVYPEIATAKFSVTTYAYASVPIYLTGTANPESVPTGLIETVNGRMYQWQGNLNQGGFKFVYNPDSDMPSLNKGVDNGTLVERTAASQPDDLFPAEKAGLYVITVDRKNLKINYKHIQYYFDKIYFIGSATVAGWDFSLSVQWDDSNPGVYVYEGPLFEGEMKLHTDTNWGGCFRPMVANGSISSTEVQYTYYESERGDLKWVVTSEEAGDYRVTLDVSEMKIYFEKL
jgi:hypothetical protein